jgi:hypothetical protein
MGHQMKNIGRSKKGMLYNSVLGSDGYTFLLHKNSTTKLVERNLLLAYDPATRNDDWSTP